LLDLASHDVELELLPRGYLHLSVMRVLARSAPSKRERTMLPNTPHTARPECPKCRVPTYLMRITPRTAGMELRMLECPKCDHVMEEIAKDPRTAAEGWVSSIGLRRLS
jgi:ribosomal protein L37AE/L43A